MRFITTKKVAWKVSFFKGYITITGLRNTDKFHMHSTIHIKLKDNLVSSYNFHKPENEELEIVIIILSIYFIVQLLTP